MARGQSRLTMTPGGAILDDGMDGPSKMPHCFARALLLVVCAAPAGCGREPQSGSPTPTAEATDAGAASSTAATADAPRDTRTKWIGDVPYDVFFDRPLETYQQAADAGAVVPTIAAPAPTVESAAVASAAAAPMPDTAATPVSDAAPATNGSSAAPVDWAAVAPISVLEAETKEMRSRLSASLQTVATYNASMDAIETDGSVLALIAAIIERHSEKVNWQDRAPFVRQLASDIYLNASAKGRGPFEKTKQPFESIVSIWDGGPAPEMEAAPLAPLGEVGDRGQVMLRFETGFNWLRADVNTATRLKEEQERVVREVTVLAALATALADPTFDGADQESYRALLQQFIDGQTAMKAAATDIDFAKFEQARNDVQKSCDACHLEYRNSSSE